MDTSDNDRPGAPIAPVPARVTPAMEEALRGTLPWVLSRCRRLLT